jgi:3-hydroxybutyryl-CoA dehydratase
MGRRTGRSLIAGGTLTPSPVVARIEDFEPGQSASFRKTFTDDDVRRFIEITGDTNPLHIDDEFAARTQFGRRIIHGMLTASLFSTMVGTLLPGTGAIYRSQTLRFLLPVYVGDTVTGRLVIRSSIALGIAWRSTLGSRTKPANASSKGPAKRACSAHNSDGAKVAQQWRSLRADLERTLQLPGCASS